MRIQVSHGADPGSWFVVQPQPGREVPGGITNDEAVASLTRAGRSVYELDVSPWEGGHALRLAPCEVSQLERALDAGAEVSPQLRAFIQQASAGPRESP